MILSKFIFRRFYALFNYNISRKEAENTAILYNHRIKKLNQQFNKNNSLNYQFNLKF